MIDDLEFRDGIEPHVSVITGVPDSTLGAWCGLPAANEGTAVAIAAGAYLATGKPGLVYLQNSGLGNAVNPLLSLANLYRIPMVLLVGWRGQPGTKDAPQHTRQGELTIWQLALLGMHWATLKDNISTQEAIAAARQLICTVEREKTQAALLVERGTFPPRPRESSSGLTREQAIKRILAWIEPHAVVVGSTGGISRELHEQNHAGIEWLNVGAMGHASQIALGIALNRPDVPVWCLDGDGAAVMHLGGLVTVGNCKPRNFRHIILNNGCYDSVGGHQSPRVDFCRVALACGYNVATSVGSDLIAKIDWLRWACGPSLLELRVVPGARPDLSRPGSRPPDRTAEFMRRLSAVRTP